MAAPFQKKSAPNKSAPQTAVTALIVWAVPKLNPRLIIAYKPDTDPTNPTNLVGVRVRDNRNFMPKQKIAANRVSATEYDFFGPLPRWKGDAK